MFFFHAAVWIDSIADSSVSSLALEIQPGTPGRQESRCISVPALGANLTFFQITDDCEVY